MATEGPSEARILRIHEVEARVGLRRSTIYKLQAAGKFPSSVALSAGAVGWISDEIECWIRNQPRTC